MAKTSKFPRIAFAIRVKVACWIMMWGVVNLVHNFLFWKNIGWPDSPSWLVTIGLAVVTGVLPAAYGIWALLREFSKD